MNLSVLVHTFNRYQHLWPGFLEAWSKYYSHPNIHCFFGTDVISPAVVENKLHEHFNLLYSGPGEWSDRLMNLLEEIPTDYVLYLQEDHYLKASPPSSYFKTGHYDNIHHDIGDLLYYIEKNDIFRLQISPINQFYSLFGSEIPLFFHKKSKYLVSHQPSIWKKSFLLECLKPGETPWVNEYEGTKRLNNRPDIQKKIAIYPYDWYSHRCIKGKVIQ